MEVNCSGIKSAMFTFIGSDLYIAIYYMYVKMAADWLEGW